ncbi:MAG: GNAT family N-acetyltransferase [Nocardioidaceae bacterium]
MTEPFAIRVASPADAQALHELGAAVTHPTYAPIAGEGYAAYVMETWWRTDYIADSMQRTTHYVAERDGSVIGTAVVGEMDGEPVLWKLYVLPTEHGTGIGSALLRTVVDGLPAGTERLLLSYLDGNTKAAAFYRSRGFGHLNTRSDSGGATNHWMALPLTRDGTYRGQ